MQQVGGCAPLLGLGEEVLAKVIACLDPPSIVSLACTCKQAHQLALAERVFQLQLLREFGLPLRVRGRSMTCSRGT